MKTRIALAGNPNSGKSTLFNNLTGSSQYVGNWPGVTVEKKEGTYKKDKDIFFMDLPGIYSLSPYTLEEVISRDYLVNEKPDVIINVIDATNIERNLYLTTQLSELGIPMVLALNMMDVVRKNKDKIDVEKLKKDLDCEVVEISALRNENIDELIKTAVSIVGKKKDSLHIKAFSNDLEEMLSKIEDSVSSIRNNVAARWFAIKLFERDEKILESLTLRSDEKKTINALIEEFEDKYDDDGEGIITDERYKFISRIVKDSVKKGRTGLTTSDKIDKVVTNRFLAIPIFALIMTAVYYVSVAIVGADITDWVNDTFFGEIIGGNVQAFLEGSNVTPWLTSLIVDGIIGGVGGVLGFLPIIATLYLFIAILEDIGYMSRIAFILDRIFRKFGLSGKSFIPILIGTGCSVPGIMATRTIESDRDRKMTIIVASFLPCGAKTEIIALFAASIFTGMWWFAPVCYFAGIAAVIISGIMLKKTAMFSGDPAPFVMELPEYHLPSAYNVFKSTFDRCKAFVIKAGTIILLATVFIWFFQNISIKGEFLDFESESTDSILAAIGKFFAPLFSPLGFGDWMATVATALGLVAKEVVVGTYGVVAGLGADLDAESAGLLDFVSKNFTTVSAMSFMIFNQLNIPCFAAIGAIREEMNNPKWTFYALAYQTGFSYAVALIIYQLGRVLVLKEAFNVWTGVAIALLCMIIYLLFRRDKSKLQPVRKVGSQSI